MDDKLIELIKGLINSYEEMYNLCYPEVERIIKGRITDVNLIEHTLDNILEIYTEKGFYLFIKLLLYYRTVNIDNAYDYLEILKNDREEEYHEFIKKYQSIKKPFKNN